MQRNVIISAATTVLAVVALLAAGCSGSDDLAEPVYVDPGTGPTTATWTLDEGFIMPQAVSELTQAQWNEMGWQSFIALNWPAEWSTWPESPAAGSGGQPNENTSILDVSNEYTAVWQTYLAPNQIFLAAGADPGGWDSPVSQVELMFDDATGTNLPIFGRFTKGSTAHELGAEFNESTNNPLIDQNNNYVNFEIRMNESMFTYFHDNGYYDAANQIAATMNNGTIAPVPKTGQESPLDLPAWAQQGAVEIKASWRIITQVEIDNGVNARYFTQRAYRRLPNGDVDGPHLFGMVGLHILRLTPNSGSTWFWTTFEQVDNVQVPAGAPSGTTASFNPGTNGAAPFPTYDKGWEYMGQSINKPPQIGSSLPPPFPVDTSFIDGAIQSGAQALNAEYQALLAGTPWAYYQMIGVQNPGAASGQNSFPVEPFAGTNANTDQLVNTTMETFAQVTDSGGTFSCTTCHSNAIPKGASTTKTDGTDYPSEPGNQIFSFLFSNAKSSE